MIIWRLKIEMCRKLTYAFVKEQFENAGCTLLSKEYVSSSKKLKYVCSEGHTHSISWNSWQSGRRCFYCNGKLKLTLDFIVAEFKKENYTLLDTFYINNKQKLRYICSRGHKGSIRWNDWVSGYRCRKCSMNIPSIKDIRKKLLVEGYTLIDTEYVNSSTKFKCTCSYGHVCNISWDYWRQGIRCATCYNNLRKVDFELIKAAFKKEGYEVLSDTYKNASTHIRYKCRYGHKHSMTWNKWDMGRRCPTCRDYKRFGVGNPNWKGGISYEPYCSIWTDKEYKESIKERDGFKCQNPDCWRKSSVLVLHHIDYDKKNCSPDNLITLCNSCNSRANYDRDYHEEFYYNIMMERYGFVYQ